jgi:guanylate kinase
VTRPGRLIIISAPSGAGKSTLCKMALAEIPNMAYSISYTTRPQRAHEIHGQHYFFISLPEFEKKKAEGFFAETALVHGHYYGTSLEQINNALNQGKNCLMDLDVQGADSLSKIYPDALTIFVLPPSIEEIRRRLESRDHGKTNNLELRIQNAQKEMAASNRFQFTIINDKVDRAFEELKKILAKELKS